MTLQVEVCPSNQHMSNTWRVLVVLNIHTWYETHTTRIKHSIPVLEQKNIFFGSDTYEDTMCTQLRHLANTSTRLDIKRDIAGATFFNFLVILMINKEVKGL